jgi:NADH-quinone oxidoreductase subunit L
MTGPLLVLGVLSAVVGFIPFSEFVTADGAGFETHLNYSLGSIAVLVGLVGIVIAYLFYKKESNLSDKAVSFFGKSYQWALDKFYFDEIYLFITKKILFKGVSKPAATFDKKIVDGSMNGIGNGTVKIAQLIKGMQSGKVQDYAFAFIAATVIMALVFVYLYTV